MCEQWKVCEYDEYAFICNLKTSSSITSCLFENNVVTNKVARIGEMILACKHLEEIGLQIIQSYPYSLNNV